MADGRSNMRVILVGAIITLAAKTKAGYNYHVPSTSLELPSLQQPAHYGYIYNSPQRAEQNGYQYVGNSIQYSVSQSDYNYLRQSKNGPYQYQTGFLPLTVHQDNNYPIDQYTSGNSGYNHGSGNSVNVIPSQGVSQQSGGISLSQTYNPSYVNEAAPAPALPVVTKHIYFHVPPPDVEEKPIQIVPPVLPKKVYNIVFIKVPSQESKNGVRIQGSLANQQVRVEDKTLIYVLVKKPDPQPIIQRPVTSQHEVFYVKYKGDVSDVANQINGQISQQESSQSSAAMLQADVQTVVEPVLQAAGVEPSLQPDLSKGRL